jgi:hypothetical protein
VVPLACAALTLAACGSSHAPPRPHRPELPSRIGGKRTLIVSMDAVPYSAAERSAAAPESRLRDLLGLPVPLVSSFPSTTTLAFTGIFEPFGIEKPPGYEARFFDRTRGRVRGGGLLSYRKIRFSWREFFDWKTHGLLGKWLSYAMPGRWSRKEVRRSIEAFLQSDHDPYFVYVGATDGVAHLRGPGGFEKVFAELERSLVAARAREDFFTVVLSDHGVGPDLDRAPKLRNNRPEVRRALRDAGYRVGKRAGEDRSALVPFGLLSSFVAFGPPDRSEDLAAALSAAPGVSVCTAAVDGGWVVRDGPDRAVVERRESEAGAELRYRSHTGDPLGYGDLGDTWRSSDDWLERTADRRFPDALHRIARAFDLVENPASAVCSTEPGTMFGPWRTDWVGRLTVGPLRWTHGALERADSSGFFWTDHPYLRTDEPVRFDRALEGLLRGGQQADGIASPRP